MKLSMPYSPRSAICCAPQVMSAAAEGAAVRMNDHRWATQTGSRCLLTFEARPRVLADLRSTVRCQLGLWGASSATDATELAVTELASNVIRHVGEGSPATLLLEVGAGRVRVEVHDTSAVLPHCEIVCPQAERGRGLALVAAVTDEWFAVPTPGGKAVCCQITVLTDPARPYEHRAARGSELVKGYAASAVPSGRHPLGSHAAVEAVTTDLITDLLHWLASSGRDPDTVLEHAQTHFEAEWYG